MGVVTLKKTTIVLIVFLIASLATSIVFNILLLNTQIENSSKLNSVVNELVSELRSIDSKLVHETEEFDDILAFSETCSYLHMNEELVLSLIDQGYFEGTYLEVTDNGEKQYRFITEKLYAWVLENTE